MTSISCREKRQQRESRNWELLAGLFVAWMLQHGQVPSRGLRGVGHLSGDDRTHDEPRTKQEDEEMLGAAPLLTAQTFLPLAAPSLLLRTESCCGSDQGRKGSSCETRRVRTNAELETCTAPGSARGPSSPGLCAAQASGWDRTGSAKPPHDASNARGGGGTG